MNRFTIPNWVKNLNEKYDKFDSYSVEDLYNIKLGLERYAVSDPEVSIIIPAWNEEKNIIKTLASFSNLTLPYKTELIVVNNNSTDSTQEILDFFGIKSYFQPTQGISVTRQLGLIMAKGKYILSADADSIYPPEWGTKYVETLINNPKIVVVYGRYSFIPSVSSRFALAIHEIIAETLFKIRKSKKDCINVMGFNSAFRKDQALSIGGYDISKSRWQDGMIAKKISEKFGLIKVIETPDSRPWTSDRRLMADGSLFKAFINRVKKELKYIHELLPFGKWKEINPINNS